MNLRLIEHRINVLKNKENKLNEKVALIVKKQNKERKSRFSTSSKSKFIVKAKSKQSKSLRTTRYSCKIYDNTHYVKHCFYFEMTQTMIIEHKKKIDKTLPSKAYFVKNDRFNINFKFDKNDTKKTLHIVKNNDNYFVKKDYVCKAIYKILAFE